MDFLFFFFWPDFVHVNQKSEAAIHVATDKNQNFANVNENIDYK